MHLDGARSWNSAVFLDMEMKDMVADFDLVNVCLSKGLGCPAGSLIAGSADEIDRARTLRKMLGGGMRQIGHLAACGLVSLMDWQEKLLIDNRNAAFMASELYDIPGVKIDPNEIETNIVRFTIDPSHLRKKKLDYFKVRDHLKEDHEILCNAGFLNDNIRFVTHRNLDRKDCEKAVKAMRNLLA